MNQKTISQSVVFKGFGLHSGLPSQVRILPANPGEGITFIRETDGRKVCIPLSIDNVANLARCTGLSTQGVSINTIEHLLFAFFVLGITNASVECENDEIPSMDGAAWIFIQKLRKAGIKEQTEPVKILKSTVPFSVGTGDTIISYQPSDSLELTMTIDFPHKDLRNKSIHLDLEKANLAVEISKARTFGFDHEIKSLHERGLGLGGNLHNTVLVTKNGYRNLFLRYPDECLRHKVLDFLGDMFISGSFFKGHFYVSKSGHKLDVEFLKEFVKRANIERSSQ